MLLAEQLYLLLDLLLDPFLFALGKHSFRLKFLKYCFHFDSVGAVDSVAVAGVGKVELVLAVYWALERSSLSVAVLQGKPCLVLCQTFEYLMLLLVLPKLKERVSLEFLFATISLDRGSNKKLFPSELSTFSQWRVRFAG